MKSAHLIRTAHSAVGFCVVSLLVCCGCNDFQHLADQVKTAATAEQWQTWAAQVLERSKTNSGAIPRSEWPAFVQRIDAPCTEWQLIPRGRSGSSSNISLVSFGGFGSFGIDVGPPTFPEPQGDAHCKQVYPGVYVIGN
jgi:hypothetical protein